MSIACDRCHVPMRLVRHPNQHLLAHQPVYPTYRCPKCGRTVVDVGREPQRYVSVKEAIVKEGTHDHP